MRTTRFRHSLSLPFLAFLALYFSSCCPPGCLPCDPGPDKDSESADSDSSTDPGKDTEHDGFDPWDEQLPVENMCGKPFDTFAGQEDIPALFGPCDWEPWDVSVIRGDGAVVAVDGGGDDWPEEARVSMDFVGDVPGISPAADLVGFHMMVGGDSLVFRLDTAAAPDLLDPLFRYRVVLARKNLPESVYLDVASIEVGGGAEPGLFLHEASDMQDFPECEVAAGAVLEIRVNRSDLPADVAQPYVVYPSVVHAYSPETPSLKDIGGGMMLDDGLYYQALQGASFQKGNVPLKAFIREEELWSKFAKNAGKACSVHPFVESLTGLAWPYGHDLWVIIYQPEAVDGGAVPLFPLGAFFSGEADWGVIAHEFAHHFNGFYHEERWLMEGHADLCRISTFRQFAGPHGDTKFFRDFYFDELLALSESMGGDFPVLDDWTEFGFDPPRYAASVMVLWLLGIEYGLDPVWDTYRDLYGMYWDNWDGYQVNASEIFQPMLEEKVGESVGWLLDSWIHGERPFPPGLGPADVVDSDLDFLRDIEENVLGTDPQDSDSDGDGLSDGWERFVGLDPMKGSSFDDGLADIQRTSVAIDGLHEDWFTHYGECMNKDPEYQRWNEGCAAESNIGFHMMAMSEGMLCGLFTGGGKSDDQLITISSGLYLDEGDSARVFIGMEGHYGASWVYDGIAEQSVPDAQVVANGYFIEFCFPTAYLEEVATLAPEQWTYQVWGGFMADNEYVSCDWTDRTPIVNW